MIKFNFLKYTKRNIFKEYVFEKHIFKYGKTNKCLFSTTKKEIIKQKKTKSNTSIKEEFNKSSFLQYNLKTNIYLKLQDLQIFSPTEIQKNVIPLLIDNSNEENESNEINEINNKNIYNNIINNRIFINNFFKNKLNIKENFYNITKYKNEKIKLEINKAPKKKKEKCFNDVYLIISPENSGKTLSYFIPIVHNFYLNNEKRMQYLLNYYNFLNKYNYKKHRNKLFRKKERIQILKNKGNMFFNISYRKYKINNRIINMKCYENYNTYSYIKNKKNNKLNTMKHKKNVYFPYAIILTNTRESSYELYSFLKNFDLNIELLTGGYLNKKKSLNKKNVEYCINKNMNYSFYECVNENKTNENEEEKEEEKEEEEENDDEHTINTHLFNSNNIDENIEFKKKKKKSIIYNIDIIIGTADKIFEKIENYKNKHLYNFHFLKYIIIEDADILCNIFNENKIKLILNHIKNYTNMYYFNCSNINDINFFQNDLNEKNENKKNNLLEMNIDENKLKTKGRKKNKRIIDFLNEITKENINEKNYIKNENEKNNIKYINEKNNIKNEIKKENINEKNNIKNKKKNENINKKNNYINSINIINEKNIENNKNTIESNIPIIIFVSPSKTVAINEFLDNNINSKYIKNIINIRSHNINDSIKHLFINSKNKEKISLLLEMLESDKQKNLLNKKYIIFCNTSKCVMNLKTILSELNYNISFIHAEMNFKERTIEYRKFRKNKTNILICTNIFSRSISFEKIQIINFDISNHINDYIFKSNKIVYNRNQINTKDHSIASFFNKKNVNIVKQIIEKTSDKKQIIFQNLNNKISKILNLQNIYYDIINKKKRKKKKGGRKALKLSPRRNCLSKFNKILSKKLYFYKKMSVERKRLIKKGILKSHEKIPRYPNRKAEIFDTNEYYVMNKLDDGSLQIKAKKRKTKKKNQEEQINYEKDTIVLENYPTYEEETNIKEKKHQKKTYF